jgi:hypothetical protein
MPGLAAVAGVLGIKNIGLAQIMAANLDLSGVPDTAAGIGVEVENLLIEPNPIDAQLARIAWQEAKHPRSGTPLNPGWFAPSGGLGAAPVPRQIAAGEREERRPEDTSGSAPQTDGAAPRATQSTKGNCRVISVLFRSGRYNQSERRPAYNLQMQASRRIALKAGLYIWRARTSLSSDGQATMKRSILR